jgi:hypothetical protein
MKRKQAYMPLINKEEGFVSPNRRTYLQLRSNGLKTERVGTRPYKRDEPKVMNGRTKAERKEIAKFCGSKGTNLKKKHLNRMREASDDLYLKQLSGKLLDNYEQGLNND